MALPVRTQLTYWGIATVVFVAVLWFLGNVLLPFVIGAAIAYFLDPLADRLEARGVSRSTATGIITVCCLLIFLPVALLFFATVLQQAANLANFQLDPDRLNQINTDLSGALPSFLADRINLGAIAESLSNFVTQNGRELFQTFGKTVLDAIVASASSVINIVVLFVIVPVVAVYMLLDWDNMIARIDQLLPRDHAPTIRMLAKQVDDTLSAFVRGMGTVCIVLGGYYAIALMLVGLEYGLVVGLIAGLITFIPYIGALFGGALAIGLGLFQFWGDWASLGLVAGIFVIGQVLEGNVLTPKLVGNSVGLHPVWLLLALSVFGGIFGFIGMLIAVPLAAVLGVLARFFADQYRFSLLYQGLIGQNTEE